jgi:hypothetical protein
MKKYILIFTAAAFYCSCANSKHEETNADTDSTRTDTVEDATKVEEKQDMPVEKKCYAWINKKDTITLTIEKAGNVVTGNLDYSWFEKDSNHGTIKGEMKGDTLFADYTFMAEGMESVRQVFFIQKGNDLVEGQPDYEKNPEGPYKGKDVMFKGTTLKPVDCK